MKNEIHIFISFSFAMPRRIIIRWTDVSGSIGNCFKSYSSVANAFDIHFDLFIKKTHFHPSYKSDAATSIGSTTDLSICLYESN